MGSLKAMLNDVYTSSKLKKTQKHMVDVHGTFLINYVNVIKHPNEVYPLLKLKMVAKKAEKQVHADPHWEFCYSILPKVSNSLALLIPELSTHSRDVICMLYLLIRVIDNVEDDANIATEIKVPILEAFHRHTYNPDWHFSCGAKGKKDLNDHFHHVSNAFIQLDKSSQKVLENVTMKMGAGMAKFICKEIETIDDYEEYCHCVTGLVYIGFSKLFHATEGEILFPDSLSNSIGLFIQKTDIIRDYVEDVNGSRKFWPHVIWSKYANNLEDFKYEDNSKKAIQCLNEMVTNALIHIDDSLTYMSQLHDPAIFRFYAIIQVLAIGNLALCYNNIQVFKGLVKMRPGLVAKVYDQTKTMADVYGAFYDFSSILKSKVDMSDPNAKTTISRIEAVQKLCMDSGTLSKWKSYVVESEPSYNRALIALLIITVAVAYAYLSPNGPNKIKSKSPTPTLSIGNMGNE